MIRGYSDHAANERTFLAWVRTAIAVMAFGFLVEKFDLFLEVAAPSLSGRTLSLPGQRFGNIAGLALIILGTAIVAIAAVRFLVTAKNIDSEEPHPGPGSADRRGPCSLTGPSGLRSISLPVPCGRCHAVRPIGGRERRRAKSSRASDSFDHESTREPSTVGVGSIGECGPFCRMTWNSVPGIELRARDDVRRKTCVTPRGASNWSKVVF